MNSIDFYRHLTEKFDRSALDLSNFLNPMLNHRDFLDMQFVYPDGQSVPPININATEVHFCDPLSGPFYQLPIDGLEFIRTSEIGYWHGVSAIVRLSNGSLSSSCTIRINADEKTIKEELGGLVDNRWYTVDLSSEKWRYSLNEQLVQEGRI